MLIHQAGLHEVRERTVTPIQRVYLVAIDHSKIKRTKITRRRPSVEIIVVCCKGYGHQTHLAATGIHGHRVGRHIGSYRARDV